MSSEGNAYTFPQFEVPAVALGQIGDALASAQHDALALREQALREGYAEGHAAGMAAATAEAQEALRALAVAAQELEDVRERMVAELEQDALGLAFDLAERILAGALAVQPERVADVARHALRHLTERRRVTLVVNPDDLAFMNHCAAELQAELGGIEHLAVQADRRVGRGGAVASTEEGEIDVGISVQLDRAWELVVETLAGELPDPAAMADARPADEVA